MTRLDSAWPLVVLRNPDSQSWLIDMMVKSSEFACGGEQGRTPAAPVCLFAFVCVGIKTQRHSALSRATATDETRSRQRGRKQLPTEFLRSI